MSVMSPSQWRETAMCALQKNRPHIRMIDGKWIVYRIPRTSTYGRISSQRNLQAQEFAYHRNQIIGRRV